MRRTRKSRGVFYNINLSNLGWRGLNKKRMKRNSVRRREDEIEDACVRYMVADGLAGDVGTEVPWEGEG